jgi:hypothetical protein
LQNDPLGLLVHQEKISPVLTLKPDDLKITPSLQAGHEWADDLAIDFRENAIGCLVSKWNAALHCLPERFCHYPPETRCHATSDYGSEHFDAGIRNPDAPQGTVVNDRLRLRCQ